MICIVILAAGLSKRFGRNKLLEKINGVTIIERVVGSVISSKADEVIVVLGHEAEKIKEVLKNYNCKFVYNEDFETGQSSSVKAGVKSVMEHAEAVLILPGDVALITSKAIDTVIDEYKKSKNPIVVASYLGRPGHPILFDHTLFDEIMKISEEKMGLKEITNKYKHIIKMVDVGSEEVLIDIDTEDDFNKMLSRMKK